MTDRLVERVCYLLEAEPEKWRWRTNWLQHESGLDVRTWSDKSGHVGGANLDAKEFAPIREIWEAKLEATENARRARERAAALAKVNEAVGLTELPPRPVAEPPRRQVNWYMVAASLWGWLLGYVAGSL